MTKNKGIILGANITGLIWKFYHPEFELISPVQGGGAPNQFTDSGQVWIHDSYETRRLLTDLGFNNPSRLKKQSHVGYWTEDGYVTDILTSEINEKIIQRKMTPWNEELSRDFVPTSRELSMTSDIGVNYMNCLDISVALIMDELRRRCPVTHGFARKIEPHKNLVWINNTPDPDYDGIAANYDLLISTIPGSIFSRISNDPVYTPDKFKGFHITNIIGTTDLEKWNRLAGKYEMIYNANPSVPWSRMSFLNGKIGFEFTGYMPKDEFLKLEYPFDIESHFYVPMGRIFSMDFSPPKSNIVFSGRFAQWNHQVTMEHTIHQALNFDSKEIISYEPSI